MLSDSFVSTITSLSPVSSLTLFAPQLVDASSGPAVHSRFQFADFTSGSATSLSFERIAPLQLFAQIVVDFLDDFEFKFVLVYTLFTLAFTKY